VEKNPSVEAALARIEAKLEAIEQRLDAGTIDIQEGRQTRTEVATHGQAIRTHSRILWGVGTGILGLAIDRLRSLL
jgi:hypothetical protein